MLADLGAQLALPLVEWEPSGAGATLDLGTGGDRLALVRGRAQRSRVSGKRLPPQGTEASELRSTGNSWTAEEVAAWKPPSLAELHEYAQQVRLSALEVLRRMDPASWGVLVRPERPDNTRAYFLHIMLRHESQHQGQIDYVAGLLRMANEKD